MDSVATDFYGMVIFLMKYYFISDNFWFLEGLRTNTFLNSAFNSELLFFIHIQTSTKLIRPEHGDIIIVNIANSLLRRRILWSRTLSFCRIIILLQNKAGGLLRTQGRFPWLFGRECRIDKLVSCLRSAQKAPLLYKEITGQEKLFFHHLGNACSVEYLATQLGISLKSVYIIKKKSLIKLGLSGRHSFDSLVGYDIAGMRETSES